MHCGYITKVKNIRKHSNADRLLVGTCFDSQVIISNETTEDTLGVYFPSDLQLSVEYCEVNNLVRKKDEAGNNIGGFLDPDKRNIRPLKLRGEISDGLFMPVKSLEQFTDVSKLKCGDVIDVLNGVVICQKYIPKTNQRSDFTSGVSKKTKRQKIGKTFYPLFKEHIDTAQLAYNLGKFKEGDLCYITLKCHGTSARTSNTIADTKVFHKGLKKLIDKILRRNDFHFSHEWKLMSGTRRVILEKYDGGYYGTNDFRKKYHDFLDGKLEKGLTVYYEIVGYEDSGRPIMGTVSNDKTQDKEFVKKYGKETTYSYGCEVGQSEAYVYRMTYADEFGTEIEIPWELVKNKSEQFGMKVVPQFDKFIYTTQEDLMDRVNKYVDGVDPIGLTHIREGVVVRIENGGKFKAFKAKNFTFKLLEGIIKDAGILDAEEQESIKVQE